MPMPENIDVIRAVTERFAIGSDLELSVEFTDGDVGDVSVIVREDEGGPQQKIRLSGEFFERIAAAIEDRRKYGDQFGKHRQSHVCAVHGYVELNGWQCAVCHPAPAKAAPVTPKADPKLADARSAAMVAFALGHELVAINTISDAPTEDAAVFIIDSSVGVFRALVDGATGWKFERIETPVAVGVDLAKPGTDGIVVAPAPAAPTSNLDEMPF